MRQRMSQEFWDKVESEIGYQFISWKDLARRHGVKYGVLYKRLVLNKKTVKPKKYVVKRYVNDNSLYSTLIVDKWNVIRVNNGLDNVDGVVRYGAQ